MDGTLAHDGPQSDRPRARWVLEAPSPVFAPVNKPLGGAEVQALTVLDKDRDGRVTQRQLLPVRFSRLETMA